MSLKPLEIYRLLPKTNCGDCGLATCLAFAQALASAQKSASACPHITLEQASRLDSDSGGASKDGGFSASIEALREKVRVTDLAAAAGPLGARHSGGRLTVHVLGREFHVDASGNVTSHCHINNWINWLALTYVSTPEPKAPEGRFVPFEELAGGRTTAGYFAKRCEEPLRVIADEHTDVFFELLGLFGARDVEGYASDFAVELRVLPNLPMLVLYTRPDEGVPSTLRVMFDPTASSYLPPELLTGMGRGIVEMFQKIIPRHEKGVLNLPYV